MALIGAQMYTLRNICTTKKAFIDACKRLKKMGYDGVQLSGVVDLPGKETRKILAGEGLVCVCTHPASDPLLHDPQTIIKKHQEMDCHFAALGCYYPDEKNWKQKTWRKFIADYNKLAKVYLEGGVRLGYHNHAHEFAPCEGVRPYDMMLADFDPSIWLEIDTYWAQFGGVDPAEYIRRAAGRIPIIHCKDMTITRDWNHKMCEVGDGNLNWPAIFEAARYAGVRWFVVERDNGDMEPFASLERSIYNMREKFGL